MAIIYDKDGNPIGEGPDPVASGPAPVVPGPDNNFGWGGAKTGFLSKEAVPGKSLATLNAGGASRASDSPYNPGIAGSSLSGEEDSQGEDLDASLERTVFAAPMGGRPRAPVLDEGTDYLSWPGGKAGWQETMVDKPKQLEEAIMQGAQAESDLGSSRADFFDRQQKSQSEELAIIKARQMERQQEMAQRQAQLDDATKRYSNDLADRGHLWANPGGIMASFGAALLSAASPGDRGIGLRLIQQNLDSDFAKRKAAANMHLGELRSNVAAYRQLAGDKDAGDRLAYAESHRIAAMELDRIAGQFQGPIAKAKAAAISKELLRSYQLQMAQIYAANIHNKAQLVDPGIKASMEKTARSNPDGYRPYNQAQPAGSQPTDQNGAVPYDWGSPGAPGQSRGTSGQGQSSQSGDPRRSAYDAAIRGNDFTPWQIKALEERSPGSSKAIKHVSDSIRQKALQEAGGDPYSPEFGKKLAANWADVNKGRADIAKAMQEAKIPARRSAYTALSREMSHIENLAKSLNPPQTAAQLIGADSDTLLSSATTAKIKDHWDALMTGDPKKDSVHQAAKRDTDAAVKKFKQIFADAKAGTIHERHGSAFTKTEQELFEESARGGWDGMVNFTTNGSRNINAEYRTALSAGGNNLSPILWTAGIGLGNPVLDSTKTPGAGPKDSYDRDNRSTHQKAADAIRGQKQLVPPAR